MAGPKKLQARLQAVCFDYRGVLLDHRTNKEILPDMEALLEVFARVFRDERLKKFSITENARTARGLADFPAPAE